MTRAEQIVEEVLQLPEEDRAWVIHKLAQSVEDESTNSVEAAWAKEIDRRIAEVDSGMADLRPWSETMAELKTRFVRNG
jgi:putative addiction module component (TIGR02574 family)